MAKKYSPEFEHPLDQSAVDLLFRGQGELAELMRQHDWAATPLGPLEQWPQSLKTAVRIMLTSQQPIWVGWGSELIYLYNDAYKSIIGGKHPWALGKPTSVVWREIWGDIGPLLATAMQGDAGTYVESQLLIMERNGYPEETHYTFSYSPIPDERGVATGIFCANTDDTQRVIGERQLALLRELATRTAEARNWQQACEQSTRALATNSRDLPFAMLYLVEPGSAATLAGTSGIAADHPAASAGEALWPITEVLRHHKPVVITDLAAKMRDIPHGAWHQAPTTAVVLPIAQSGDSGRTGVLVAGLNPFRLFDQSYAGFLDLVVGQIAAAIANADAYEQERHRAEVLAELDRVKTAFFSNISHEFRTPLTLMLNPLEEMLAHSEERIRPENRALVSVAHRNGMRLLKLVNTLLDFSRIEAGRVTANYQPLDLAALTADIASTFRSTIERAGVRLRVDCKALPEFVYVDPDMWEKIVLNLLSNAFKFTFEGEIAVSVRADAGFAELVVRDTGIGIRSEDLARIFERFHRVEGAKGRSIEGSGIGLALVRELAALHGGSIEVDSEIGRGTEFRVKLPLGSAHLDPQHIGAAEQYAPAMRAAPYVQEAASWLNASGQGLEATTVHEAASVALTGKPGTGQHILLADDNPDMRGYLQRLLTEAGYRVTVVADGETALHTVRVAVPDLVLSDVMMPKLDGFGLLAALRTDPALHEMPVILLSARAGEEAKIEGLQAGADDYLIKPFSSRELLVRIETNLKLAEARRERAQLLWEEAQVLEQLNRVGNSIAAELDLERAVQTVTDAATELSGAAFGSFFYNVTNEQGEAYTLYTLAGAPREAFANFPMPRNTAVFAPTFKGEGIVRSPDITRDPRFGKNSPHYGMPKGHLPLRSYLAVPVKSRTGEVYGGLFFGHPDVDVFDARAERIVAAIALQASTAIENARLYRSVQEELEQRRRSENALRESEQSLEQKITERTRELADINARLLREVEGRTKAEGMFRMLVEGVRDYAIFMLSRDGIVTSWNAGAERIKGYRASEIIGQHFSRFYTDEDRAAGVPVRALQTATERGTFEAEGWRVRKDGSRFVASVVINAIHDRRGQLLGFAKVTRDITEREEAQEALMRTQEQLAQAQKMEGIGQLTGGVAHDFNNLLTVITGNLDSIQRTVQKKPVAIERIERAAGFAMTGAQRATALTQRLLAFARRQPLDPKAVNVSRLVIGMSEMLRRTLGEQIAIETVLAGGLWQVLVDPNQLEMSIVNLAVNARHAMPDGGKLTIETANTYLDEGYAVSQSEVVPGQYVVICVSDSGVGMTPEVLSRAFEPFFTTKEIGQGTGLGLSQVYGFVKQSGGHVKIYSELGHGTTVKLYLPRLHSSEDTAESPESESRAPGAAGETILVVEDDNDVRAYSTSILGELGYSVLEASTGAAALRVLESHPEIELLFTDVGLPGGMNGRQLADAARELRPSLKILFTTGYARNAIVHDGRLDPGVVLITKPFSYVALAAKLRDVLDRHIGPRRILLVEDEPLVATVAADYLKELGYKVEATSTATEAINRAKLLHGAFDFVVIDVGLPDRSGAVLVRELRTLYPTLQIVVASGQHQEELRRRYRGDTNVRYIAKPYTREQLQEIVPRAPA